MAGYLFPAALLGAAIFLALKERRFEQEIRREGDVFSGGSGRELEKPDKARRVRRGIGIFLMIVSAVLISMLIYKLEMGVADIPLLLACSAVIILITAIGIWDVFSESRKLRASAARMCREDYQNLLSEIAKAERRGKASGKGGGSGKTGGAPDGNVPEGGGS